MRKDTDVDAREFTTVREKSSSGEGVDGPVTVSFGDTWVSDLKKLFGV
jgi:hypothetical protein